MNQNERIGSQAEYDALKGEELSAQIRVAMPAIVTRVNLEAQTVEVKLALQGKVLGATGEKRSGLTIRFCLTCRLFFLEQVALL